MKTVSFKISKEMLKRVDKLVNNGEFPSRSEFIRESIRRNLKRYERKKE
ncbi:MAG: ribbon-helix-helix protein, CopG family [Candidatus Korarchaeota archaeon]|nr:ribbon-helix-helix protein, CopG family [Candidatus Korarchaeota archaeon]NIU84148.1 ribbon-helix-helix protein, CopG family [Candidatus Thorarchaeota archaeon]NIW14293.1 ribbon-helix-helix protein, CopG family [Candidatus Thorarchaeota archaeon]NIW52390.1 ribbon-helix-helix protein, CopG family [Candidatus Korarchaeota archaeon]